MSDDRLREQLERERTVARQVVEKLQAENEQLKEALRTLLDEQIYAPIVKREKQWKQAIDGGYRALGILGPKKR